jgi:KaiC/GvpD/RAD55 family RecA-like ATPase
MKPWVQELVSGVEPYAVVGSRNLYSAPPVEYLIEGILPLYSVIGMTGFPGTGKTWLSMEMMRAVASGTSFLGKFPVKKAPVLFVGNDASLLDYAQQWRRLTLDEYEGYDHDRLDLRDADTGEITRPALRDSNPLETLVHFLIQSEFNFDDLTQVARLIKTSHEVFGDISYDVKQEDGRETIEESTRKNFGLIVFDTLTKMTTVPEENNTARSAVFSNIRLIAESTGATVLVLHHNALTSEYRTGEEFRGAGDQFASLDVHFHLITRAKGLVEFKTKKFRGITPEPFLFNLGVHTPGPASLDYNSKPTTKDDWDGRMIDDLVSVLKTRENSVTTVADFAIALLSRYSEQFDDIKRFKRHISNVLGNYTRTPDARIVAAVTGKGGRSTLFKLSPIEVQMKEVSGGLPGSDQSNPEGTSARTGEASDVAGESSTTGSDSN